jgi:DNA-binding CsgD family transcriptional regulator
VQDCDDAMSFGARLAEGVRELVPGEPVSFNVVDLRNGGGEIVFDPPEALTPQLAESFYAHAGEHPLIRLHEARGVSEPHVLSEVASLRRFRRTALYSEVLGPLGVVDQLAFAVVGAPGRVVGVAVCRDSEGFEDREVEMLRLLNRPLVHAYRAVLERERERTLTTALSDRLDALGRATVVVDRFGRVEWRSPLAERLLVRHGLDGEAMPAGALDGGTAPVAIARTGAATLWVAGPGDPLDGGRRVLHLGEDDLARDRARVCALGVTARQAEVLLLCAQGLANAEIADRLRISQRTVHRHLEDAYRRLEVPSRSAATRVVLTALEGNGLSRTAEPADTG